jgi:hypothetical protein
VNSYSHTKLSSQELSKPGETPQYLFLMQQKDALKKERVACVIIPPPTLSSAIFSDKIEEVITCSEEMISWLRISGKRHTYKNSYKNGLNYLILQYQDNITHHQTSKAFRKL